MTRSQYDEVKRRSSAFSSMTHFVNQAIKEFSDTTAKDKLKASEELAKLYAAIDAKLAHVGGNLNQAMRRINESAIAGIDYSILLRTRLLPEVENCIALCIEIRKSLIDITQKAVK